MAQLRTPAIICAVRTHGEHGAIVRSLTPDHGLIAGYVRGAKSRTHRPILIPGNLVAAEFRARTEAQLASLTVELTQSRGPQLGEPLASAAYEWVTALTAATLPEEHPYPRLYDALSAVLDAIGAAPSAKGWAVALARYEILLLEQLGFGGGEAQLGGNPEWPELFVALKKNGRALDRHLFDGRFRDVMGARTILIDRLQRVMG